MKSIGIKQKTRKQRGGGHHILPGTPTHESIAPLGTPQKVTRQDKKGGKPADSAHLLLLLLRRRGRRRSGGIPAGSDHHVRRRSLSGKYRGGGAAAANETRWRK